MIRRTGHRWELNRAARQPSRKAAATKKNTIFFNQGWKYKSLMEKLAVSFLGIFETHLRSLEALARSP